MLWIEKKSLSRWCANFWLEISDFKTFVEVQDMESMLFEFYDQEISNYVYKKLKEKCELFDFF